jgi:hypothetical protein
VIFSGPSPPCACASACCLTSTSTCQSCLSTTSPAPSCRCPSPRAAAAARFTSPIQPASRGATSARPFARWDIGLSSYASTSGSAARRKRTASPRVSRRSSHASRRRSALPERGERAAVLGVGRHRRGGDRLSARHAADVVRIDRPSGVYGISAASSSRTVGMTGCRKAIATCSVSSA